MRAVLIGRRDVLIGAMLVAASAGATAQTANVPAPVAAAGAGPAGTTPNAAGSTQAGSGGLLGWISSLGLGAAFVGLLSWGGARLYEQVANSLAQRRTFAAETAKRVVELSWTHYWALANAAGTLGSSLREYLQSVEAHLFVSYIPPGSDRAGGPNLLRERLTGLASDHADKSFPDLVRLIILFHQFQFRGSNNYLLPGHASADALRRLYNRFVRSLPDDPFLATIRRQVEAHLAKEPKTAAEAAPAGLSGAFLEDSRQWKELGLQEAAAQWRSWFAHGLPQVHEASEALETYADLIAHELARLNAAFFHDRYASLGVRGIVADWAGERWPALLTERSMLAIARSDHLPRAFLPLGGVARPSGPGRPPAKEEADAADAGGPGDGSTRGPSGLGPPR